jgi:phenylacetate-CoA ligase
MNATVKESPEARGPAAVWAATAKLARRLAWDPAAMAAHRQAALRETLSFAFRHSPWHHDRLAGIDLDGIATDDLSQLPVMTRTELMANWDQIVTEPDLTLASARAHLQVLDEGGPLLLRGRYLVLATGGSTGEPAVFCRQTQEVVRWLAGTGRWLSAGGQAPPRRFVSVGARSLRHGSAALPAFLYGQRPDRLLVPVDQPLSSIIERLNELQPDVLHTYGSILGVLAQAAAAGSLRLSLTQLRFGADALPAGAADAAQAAFGVRPIQVYPTTDVGHIAMAEAGGNDDLYVNHDLLVLEAVDEADRPVAYGQCCHHLLVTSLYQRTLPMIRYRIDDRVILQPPSERHPAFSRIGSIDGRSGDLFDYGGLIVHPHTFRAVIARHLQIRDYRVRQTADGAAISIVADPPVDVDVVTDQFMTALAKAGLTDPRIEVTRVDTIPRTASGKQELFVPARN